MKERENAAVVLGGGMGSGSSGGEDGSGGAGIWPSGEEWICDGARRGLNSALSSRAAG